MKLSRTQPGAPFSSLRQNGEASRYRVTSELPQRLSAFSNNDPIHSSSTRDPFSCDCLETSRWTGSPVLRLHTPEYTTCTVEPFGARWTGSRHAAHGWPHLKRNFPVFPGNERDRNRKREIQKRRLDSYAATVGAGALLTTRWASAERTVLHAGTRLMSIRRSCIRSAYGNYTVVVNNSINEKKLKED